MFRCVKKDNKGITLVVLIVTIIILLILAAIAVNQVTDDNGLIKLAQSSKEQVEKEILEKNKLLQDIIKNEFYNDNNTGFDEDDSYGDFVTDEDESYGGDSTIDPVTHTCNKNTVEETLEDCGNDGKIIYKCSFCKEIQEEEIIPATGKHTWDEGVVTKSATCTVAGIETYNCKVCGAEKTEIIEATGKHTVEFTNYGDYNNWYHALIGTCTVCKGENISYSYESHNYINGICTTTNGNTSCEWECNHDYAQGPNSYYESLTGYYIDEYGYCKICKKYLGDSSGGDTGGSDTESSGCPYTCYCHDIPEHTTKSYIETSGIDWSFYNCNDIYNAHVYSFYCDYCGHTVYTKVKEEWVDGNGDGHCDCEKNIWN